MSRAKEAEVPKTLYCSFCKKSQYEVRKLIAGPGVYICDECVEICEETVEEDVPVSPEAYAIFDAVLKGKRGASAGIFLAAFGMPIEGTPCASLTPVEMLARLKRAIRQHAIAAFPKEDKAKVLETLRRKLEYAKKSRADFLAEKVNPLDAEILDLSGRLAELEKPEV